MAAHDVVPCLLCSKTQLDPGDSYNNHLVYEHGVIFGAEFLIQSSLHKLMENELPLIRNPCGKPYASAVEVFCQTSDTVCANCSEGPAPAKEELDSSSPNPGVSSVNCWLCPLCPMVYKRRYHFDHHIQSVHQLLPEEVSNTWESSLSVEEFNEKQHQAFASKVKKEQNENESGVEKPWGPKAFSTSFQCKLCSEQFKRDSDLLVHIKLVHSGEPKDLVNQALDNLSHSKLDGCVYQCDICKNKYNTSTSFMRHVKEQHGLSLKQYNQLYGRAEIVSGVFHCRICSKDIKHTRNIISAHMKMVHQISWQEYQNRINEGPSTELDGSSETQQTLAPVVLFECALCDSKVKLKRQHLDHAHCMEEDVYEAFLQKGFNDDEKTLVEGAVLCKICKKLSMDLKKHLKLSHKQMSVAKYDMIPQQNEEECDQNPTKLKCYFECDAQFNRDVDLQVHIKLKHPDVSSEELSEAKVSALEENFPKSMSIDCKVCGSTLSGRSSFWGHITRKHQLNVKEYEDKFGKLATVAEHFTCKVCANVLKYERSTIEGHLNIVHRLSWSEYLSWNEDEELVTAPVKLINCKLCSSSVKSLKGHLKSVHSMTVKDYDKLGKIDSLKKDSNVSSSHQEALKVQSSSVDIRDKTMKTCSKCRINFSTRRQFIEHCQVDHGMKFKLKSGECLPLPAEKRKLTNKSPDAKRMRLNTS